MKYATRLSKGFTPEKKKFFTLLFTALALLLPLSGHSQEELGNTNTDQEQFSTANACYSTSKDLLDKTERFTEACSKAGLTGGEDQCLKKLKKCSKGRKRSYCLDTKNKFSTAEKKLETNKERLRDLEEKAREDLEKQEDLQADLEESQLELIALKEKITETQVQINSLDQKYADLKIDKVKEKVATTRDLTEKIAQSNDQLNRLEMRFRKFLLASEMKCREQAQKRKQDYLDKEYSRISSGKNKSTSLNGLLAMGEFTMVDRGNLMYRVELAKCMSPFKSGDRTKFGSNLAFERDNTDLDKDPLTRNIRNLDRARSELDASYREAFTRLSRQQASELNALRIRLNSLTAEQRALIAKQSNIRSNFVQLNKDKVKSSYLRAKVEADVASSYGNFEEASDDERLEAFATAMALSESLTSLEKYAGGISQQAETPACIALNSQIKSEKRLNSLMNDPANRRLASDAATIDGGSPPPVTGESDATVNAYVGGSPSDLGAQAGQYSADETPTNTGSPSDSDRQAGQFSTTDGTSTNTGSPSDLNTQAGRYSAD